MQISPDELRDLMPPNQYREHRGYITVAESLSNTESVAIKTIEPNMTTVPVSSQGKMPIRARATICPLPIQEE